ncbi:hypothetical protein OG900_05410 [Streptomyces sp. NBC_00433]
MPIDVIRRTAAAISVAALAAVPATVVATPAAATPYPPGPGALCLSSTRPFAGAPLSFLGTGFAAREQVAARLDTTLLRTVRSDWRGAASGVVTIPRNTTSGPHSFSLTGLSSGRVLSKTVVVRRPFHRRAADTASANINAAPVASQATAQESGPSHTTLAAGSAAALCAFGGSSYLLHRRRRRHSLHQ